MSISVGIGVLALFLADEDDAKEIEEYLETYRQLSRFLAAHGYPGYEEPRTLPWGGRHRGRLRLPAKTTAARI